MPTSTAQVEKDIWQVIEEYFRTPIAWIDFQLFFPPSFFPDRPQVSGGFYFPGGWMLGALLTVNLLAAHGARFTVQARGWRLAAGLAAVTVGVLLTTSIIVAGAGHDGLRQAATISWSAVWRVFQVTLAVAVAGMVCGVWKMERSRRAERRLLWTGAALLVAVLAWMLYRGDSGRLNDSSLRILWQLGKGTLAGLVLLAGCVLIFKKLQERLRKHEGCWLAAVALTDCSF